MIGRTANLHLGPLSLVCQEFTQIVFAYFSYTLIEIQQGVVG